MATEVVKAGAVAARAERQKSFGDAIGRIVCEDRSHFQENVAVRPVAPMLGFVQWRVAMCRERFLTNLETDL